MLKEIKMNYRKARKQTELFTPNHVIYNCDFTIGKQKIKATYQCNPKFGKPTKNEVLECILSDANAYETCADEADFLIEFGYNESAALIRDGMKAYKGCKAISEKLHRVFTDKQLEELNEEIQAQQF